MAFQKGQPKPANGGRKKGSINKKTKEFQAALDFVSNTLEDTILTDIQSVSPSRRLQLYTDLMNYSRPKLSSTRNENDNKFSGGLDINISFDDLGITPDSGDDE